MRENQQNILVMLWMIGFKANHTLFHFSYFSLLLINGGTQKREYDTSLWINTNSCYYHFTTAFHDMSAGQYHRIERFTLFNMIRFTSQRWLINLFRASSEIGKTKATKHHGIALHCVSLVLIYVYFTFKSLLCINIPSAGRRSPYFIWHISPTTISPTEILFASPLRITANLCSPSIRFCRPRNCLSLE